MTTETVDEFCARTAPYLVKPEARQAWYDECREYVAAVKGKDMNNVVPLPKPLQATACADCGNELFRIYMTQAHPAGRRGAIRIACAACDKTIMEQSGGD